MKGISWAQLMRHAVSVSADPRPEPAAGSVTYRCGARIYIHKTEWRTACLKAKTPHAKCACNQPQESEVAA